MLIFRAWPPVGAVTEKCSKELHYKFDKALEQFQTFFQKGEHGLAKLR